MLFLLRSNAVPFQIISPYGDPHRRLRIMRDLTRMGSGAWSGCLGSAAAGASCGMPADGAAAGASLPG